MKINHRNYLKLAFNIANINLGKTKTNPSVGCVVVKNNSVISTGITSKNGRPHAEFNALKGNKDFKGSDLYVTMEPCTHYGETPPCSNIILKRGIKRVFYSFNDIDKRTANKFKKKNIIIKKKKINSFKDFYKSYFLLHKNEIPFVDAKIAISKDYYTISKYSKWITNSLSRNKVHLIRSKYDAIMSTSKSINKDNSMLNCRLNGFDKSKPDLFIVDLDLKIRLSLDIFQKEVKRNIYIFTTKKKHKNINYLKKKGIKFIQLNRLKNKKDFIQLFNIIRKLRYNRILVECGLSFLNELLKNRLIYNLYLFQSIKALKKNGINNASNRLIKKLRLIKKVKVNLQGDNLYKIKIK